MYSCPDCDVAFPSAAARREHERASGHNAPSSSAQPAATGKRKSSGKDRESAVRCRRCGDFFPSRRVLYEHRMLSHSDHVTLQPNPWVNAPDDAPWANGSDPELKHTYDVHAPIILRPHKSGAVKSVYNFPISNDVSMMDIRREIEHIFAEENASFKINVSFGLILFNVETGEYRFFAPYHNAHIFPKPVLIKRYGSLAKLYERMSAMNLTDYIMQQRPDTKWKPFMVTNVRYSVFKTGYPMGCGADLPRRIVASKSIVALIVNVSTGNRYDDNLCAFRCLAYHRTHSLRRERLAKRLFQRWRRCASHLVGPFNGVRIEDLPIFEECFEVNVNVYELNEDNTAMPIYASRHHYESTMNLNICGNHLSYITRLSSYCRKYSCRCCGRCSNTAWKGLKHERRCDGKTKWLHPGGYYAPHKTIYDRLAEWNIRVEQHHYVWFMVFDFEVALMAERQSDSIWRHSHRPISVSVASNVPGFEGERFYFSDDLDRLLTDMIRHMTETGARAGQLAICKWRHAFRALRRLIDLWRIASDDDEEEETADENEDGDAERPPNVFRNFLAELNRGCWSVNFNSWTADDDNDDDDEDEDNRLDTTVFSDEVRRRSLKVLTQLYRDLARYCQEVPVLGFNSAKYDMNLIKSKVSKHLGMHDNGEAFTVKRANSYMCMTKGRLRFLDIMQYIPPGTSYSRFLKTFGIAEEKSYFPYEWLDGVDKLRHVALPPMESFWSSLKGANTLESEERVCYEMLLTDGKSSDQALSHMNLSSPPATTVDSNYAALQRVWKERKMKTMLDFLEYYNNLDVGPFRDATTKFQVLFFEKDVDIFKSCISAPGAARIMLFRHGLANGASFALCGKTDADLYKTIKANIVGGPSIVFHRHNEVGVTHLRGADGKTCRSIIRFDANALYLHAIAQAMPVNNFVRRSKMDGFFPHVRDRHQLMFDWMDYVNHSQWTSIQHKMNHHTEKRVGCYYMDGFDPVSGIHYELHGCYYHGHRWALTNGIRNERWRNELRDKFCKRTEAKRDFLDAMGLKVSVMLECEFRHLIATNDNVREFVNVRRQSFHRLHPGRVNVSQILTAVRNEDLFGMVEVDIRVPCQWGDVVPGGTTLDPATYFGE